MTSLVVTGSHPLVQKIRSLASRLATCDTPALILGERGTGKGDLARHIHQQSRRSTGPFVWADCTSTMSAKELTGRVDEAHGGTLLLADVDTLEPGLRPLLLEGIDGRRLPLADSPSSPANVRLIASAEPELTPTALEDDFLARLSRVSLFLPPLRERRSDIPLLIRHVLGKHAAELDGPARRVPDDTLVLLWQYDWPGNLRELAAVVRQAASAAADGVIRATLLPAHIRWPHRRGTPPDPARSGSEASQAPGKLANDERDPRFFAKV